MSSTSGDLVHVVDDDEGVRRSLNFLICAAGYRVIQWSSGAKFLKEADRTVPACVLLNVGMPGLGGFEVQRKMTEKGLDFPVVMISGDSDTVLAVKAIMAGVVDFLQKPVDRDKLLGAIAAAFGRLGASTALYKEQAWADIQLAKLTEREHHVLDGLACGYSNKIIAHDLGLSARTVDICRATLMGKLQIVYFADALRIALKGGLGAEKDWRDRYGAKETFWVPLARQGYVKSPSTRQNF